MNKMIVRKTIEGRLKQEGKLNRRKRRRLAKMRSKELLRGNNDKN